MKSHTEYLTFNLPERMAFLNITPQVEEVLRKSGIAEGLLLCKESHTARQSSVLGLRCLLAPLTALVQRHRLPVILGAAVVSTAAAVALRLDPQHVLANSLAKA